MRATMKMRILALAVAALGGCAAFEQPAEFPLERYPGATRHEQLLAKVNIEANLGRPCALLRRCQEGMPSRVDLITAPFLDGLGYALAKSYALQDAGIDERRMRIAHFNVLGTSRVALVVDERYVLDNMDSNVRRLDQYGRMIPQYAALPEVLMAQGRLPGDAAVGR
jgi:hypothetical protein